MEDQPILVLFDLRCHLEEGENHRGGLSALSLEHKTVSIIGKMGIPPSAPGIVKLIVEKLVSHDDIAKRAYEIDKSRRGGSTDENWFRAERELLGLAMANQHPAAL